MINVDSKGIELGDEVKDTITGFEGVAIAITQWITGCPRITVQPKVGKDGKVPEASSFDVLTLVVKKKKKAEKVEMPKKTGGPRPNLPQHGY